MRYDYVTCDRCKNTVKRGVRHKKDVARYCSRECAFAHNTLLSVERKALRRIGKRRAKLIKKAERDLIRAEKEKALRIERDKKNNERLKCVCKECGVDFKQRSHLGAVELYCNNCALENKRKERRISRSRRRARIRGSKHEPIDPLFVFEISDWSCYICGENTPKELRGTTNPRAPELDHITPLSKGGSHTLDNVACCCRQCNNIKSDELVA